ncbi:MAG: hypothetical protein ABWY12_13560, partial [Burkholderiales bacterium]
MNASEEIETERVKDLETLRRHASDLRRKADAATQTYDRTAWIRYAAIFVPIPFVVLLLRFHLEPWGYYVAGALFVAVALVMYAMGLAAVAKRDTIQAAQRAQAVYDRRPERDQEHIMTRAPLDQVSIVPGSERPGSQGGRVHEPEPPRCVTLRDGRRVAIADYGTMVGTP